MSSNPNQDTNPSSKPNQPQPGMIAGHAEYIKGAAEVRFRPSFPRSHCYPFPSLTTSRCLLQAVIGNITGSHAWTTSGEQDKAHAKASLQAATEGRDPAASGYGSVEETAGKLTGCEWMKKEGAASKSHQE
ncbi:hypothetical protein QBC32DRAFT_330472 [Pseudoneurospora amorphoporcata]|uniref:Uncharacterized protein n=1 Tax=Pseudoneurospora amorphoporcata TaxID=241081 RepID=A0AAN6P2S9_9PEZI|nr:hypothetical protein QBC32DRAFT_330472 [Pseudoneurospora amorphoporcata]